jgi:hypothetical protein
MNISPVLKQADRLPDNGSLPASIVNVPALDTPDLAHAPAVALQSDARALWSTTIRKAYVGIDNGFTGAMALLLPDDTIQFQTVLYRDLGKEKLLDIHANRAILRGLLKSAEATNCRVFTIFEQSPITPAFGAKNNYTNGKNNEFWRVLLSLEEIPFGWANARRWQKDLFVGIRGGDTKEMARLVVRQRFPKFDCGGLTDSQQEGVDDAICLALWARETNK